eukprot:6213138-Pleurochrysis_carterae.AAC.7
MKFTASTPPIAGAPQPQAAAHGAEHIVQAQQQSRSMTSLSPAFLAAAFAARVVFDNAMA